MDEGSVADARHLLTCSSRAAGVNIWALSEYYFKRVFIELNTLANTLFTYGLHLQKNQLNLVEYLDGQLVGVR